MDSFVAGRDQSAIDHQQAPKKKTGNGKDDQSKSSFQ
jgi:hypothetical protein